MTVSRILLEVGHLVCVGDFNIDLLRSDAVNSRLAKSIFEVLSLEQLINEPTRITANSSTLIDFILTNKGCPVATSGTLPDKLAHHQLTYCNLAINRSNNRPIFKKIRDYKNINVKDFESDLQSIPWRNIYDIDSVDDKIKFISDNILTVLSCSRKVSPHYQEERTLAYGSYT